MPRYLEEIKKALSVFFSKDGCLLDEFRKTHEQTISFRIAHYLAKRLEGGEFFVDCEFHGDVNNKTRRKELYNPNNGKVVRVRPDIIYHDRSKRNEFCIEIKRLSARKDKQKVQSFVKANLYNEGYCLYGFKRTGCKVAVFYKDGNGQVVAEEQFFEFFKIV